MLRLTIILILLSITVNAQTMLNPDRANTINPPGGGGAIPDIVYADTSITTSAGEDSLAFTHWGSIAANQLMLLVLINEGTADNQWGTGADTVSEAGWTFLTEGGSVVSDNYVGVFYRIADGTESGSFYVKQAETREACGWYLVLDSVDTSNPINVVGDTTLVAPSLTLPDITLEAATTTGDNCLALGLVASGSTEKYDDADTVSVTGTGWSLYDKTFNRISPYTTGGIIAQKDVTSTGSTGSPTIYHGYVDAGQAGAVGFIIAVKGKQ